MQVERACLQLEIERLFDENPKPPSKADFDLFASFLEALNHGDARAAEPDGGAASGWRVNTWVKKGILIGFRMGAITDMSIDVKRQPFFDKATYPVKQFDGTEGV